MCKITKGKFITLKQHLGMVLIIILEVHSVLKFREDVDIIHWNCFNSS